MILSKQLLGMFLVAIFLGTVSAGSAGESAQARIARALSAGPSSVASGATVVDVDAHGKATTLRKGTNGFTCFPGHKGVIGDDPACLDAQAMIWNNDWLAHRPRPTYTQPGIMYMFAGAADYSATNPWATKAVKPLREGPHWMIMWPYDPKKTGLSSKASDDGTWIMWADTPYAHLMINQHW